MNDKTPGRLAGLRIAVTREEPGELAQMLQAEGAEVHHCPLIRIVSPNDLSQLTTCLERIEAYSWIAFTSGNAVRMTCGTGKPLKGPRVACVGDSTGEQAASKGLIVDLIPQRPHVKGLIEAFAALPERGRVLYPRSEIAPGTLREGLQALGYEVDDPVAYTTVPNEEGMQQLAAAIEDGVRAIAFASPSAVRNAATAVGEAVLKKAWLYSIGPTTSAAVREAGAEVAGEARVHNVASLVEAIVEGEAANG